MSNREQFEALPMDEKGKLVLLEKGKFIGHRNYYNQRLVLYDMGSFFAEVWYELNENKIRDITALPLESKTINIYIDKNKPA